MEGKTGLAGVAWLMQGTTGSEITRSWDWSESMGELS